MSKTLPNGKTVETYPLTQAQRFMFFVYKQFGNNSPVLNIGSGYYFKDDFRADLMKEALEEAIARCDVMRLRFTLENVKGNMQVMQYLVDEPEVAVEEVDLSDMSYEESYQVMKGWTKTLIPMFDAPLNTVRLIRLCDGLNGMYLKFHHLAFDGYAAKAFISDVMGIYLSKKTGAPYPKTVRIGLPLVSARLGCLSCESRHSPAHDCISLTGCWWTPWRYSSESTGHLTSKGQPSCSGKLRRDFL